VKNILIFGDSLSAGYGIARDASWASLLQQELQRTHPQYQVVNASISGETTAGGLGRITRALQEHRPSIVIIELGANDGLRGSNINAAEDNLGEIIRQSQISGAKVLLLGMQLPPNYGADYTARFKELYPKLSQRYHVTLVPFIAAALAIESFAAFLARFRGHLGLVEKAMGGLLVFAGIAFFTGWITDLGSWLIQAFPDLGKLAI